jgi:hypothetical protein
VADVPFELVRAKSVAGALNPLGPVTTTSPSPNVAGSMPVVSS